MPSQILDDLHPLRSYGITDGAVLAHVATGIGAADSGAAGAAPDADARAVDYAAIAALLAQAHRAALAGRANDPHDYVPPAPVDAAGGGGGTASPGGGGAADGGAGPRVVVAGGGGGDWPGAWTRGGEYMSFPPVLVGRDGTLPREDVVWGVDDGHAAAAEAEVEKALRALAASLGGDGSGGEAEDGAPPPAPATGAATAPAPVADGAAVPTASEAAIAVQRAELRATLVKLRQARRARQALVARAPGRLVPFDEAAAAHGHGGADWARIHVP